MDIEKIAGLFTEKFASIRSLNGFHNYIYEVSGDTDFILRISQQQNEAATSSEIDFLQYLYQNDGRVAPPIPSLQNQYVHLVVIDEKKYIVSAYQKADGRDFSSRGIDNKERFIIIGRALGKIHQLSKMYVPNNVTKRRLWSESPHIIKAPDIFLKYNMDLLKKFHSYMSHMHNFPKDQNCFGLVHGDFLFSNYFFDDGNNITIFDFDECEYSWYMYDIAVCMYYYLLGGDPRELDTKVEEAEEMLYHLFLGYKDKCEIDIDCLRNMDLFLQLREYVLLSSVLESSTEDLKGWSKHFVEGAVERLLTDKPFIPVDFEKVYCRVVLI
jgi:Ser/Thr protein kinase RdoA (MazF antagonist)